jgi:hypothetical protein
MTRLRLPAVALLLLLSATAWADLRTYDVAQENQQEIYNALVRILDPAAPTVAGGASYGRVQLLPSGQILVNAPPETLEQVDAVLQAIRSRPVPETPRAALRYWGVLGTRAPSTVGSPPPPVLNDVLGELKRLHGELTFRVIGTAAVTTNSGQAGEVRGTTLAVEQMVRVQGDTLSADIEMQLSGNPGTPQGFGNGNVPFGSLKLRTTLKRGEFVVLGENHVQAGTIDGPVFYIVHWAE